MPAEAIRSVAEVEAPPGLVNLPHRTDAFVGRANELKRLDAIMEPTGKAVLHAVHGLGGVGDNLLTSIATGRQVTSGSGHPDLDGTAELCNELGNLPLAIEQAAAFLRQTQETPRGYLSLLAKYPAAMYDQAPVSGDAERTVARIWRVTLDQLATTPMAGAVASQPGLVRDWQYPTGHPGLVR